MNFVLAFHNHQPVGNFENIFREAFEKCYEPFLKFLEDHSFFRVSLHYSGCLLDWLEASEKQFLRRLGRLVKQNQVELLSGGYYEPILPLIPERDAIEQIRFMNKYLKRRFGKTPSGFWLTERVWEGRLPRIAAEAGLRYTTVDDTHFALAGLAEHEIRNFFITEEEGSPLYVFPIPKSLRYMIPFREPDETLGYLRELSREANSTVATYADDGEKFGLWPGTYQWVYRDGWLDRFARALEENQTWITLRTFTEILDEGKGKPAKKVYLPNASYEEMTEWSLSREKAYEFQHLKGDLESSGLWGRARIFIQGGTFKNFLVKYSEADWMRSKMRWTSEKVAKVKDPSRRKKAQRELWQGQCNCPYWHGIFGGLYLHHLRRSTYEHLLRAEAICRLEQKRQLPDFALADLNQDGGEEVVIESSPFSFYFLPHRGGSLAELDFHPEAMNLIDTVTRRREVYHREWGDKKESVGSGRSIHEMNKTISREVMERLAFDTCERFSLLDHFLASQTTFEEFWKSKFRSLAQPSTQTPYIQRWKREKGEGILKLKGKILLEPAGSELTIEKCLQVKTGEDKFSVSWTITNGSSQILNFLWGSEWSFNFFDRERNENQVRGVQIQDGWSPVHLEITGEEAFDYWQFPIETVAQTEKDFRLIHQGISVFPHWRLTLAAKENFARSLTFSFSSRRE